MPGVFQVNFYDPTDWHVAAHKLDADKRFQASGRVALVQDPSGGKEPGKARLAIYTWSSLPDLEAQLAGFGARTPKPDYDPNQVASPGLGAGGKGLILLILAGALFWGLSLPKPEEQPV